MEAIVTGVSITVVAGLILYLGKIIKDHLSRWFNRVFRDPIKDMLLIVRTLRLDVNAVMKYLMVKNGFQDFLEKERENQIQELTLSSLNKQKE